MKKQHNPIILMAAIATGFGSSFLKAKVRTAELLPVGKHVVTIISAEYEAPKENEQFKRDEDELQLKVVMKNAQGIITAWLNDRGFTKFDELTALDIPADLNYKVLGTNAKDFRAMSDAKKMALVFDASSDGYAIRKDTGTRILSEKNTQAAMEISGGCLGAAGITEDQEFTQDELPALLVGKVVKIAVEEKSYGGLARKKVKSFMLPTEAELESMVS